MRANRPRASRTIAAPSAIALALAALSALPCEARHRHGRTRLVSEAHVRLGLYDPEKAEGSGIFAGIELATRSGRHLTFGVTGDYAHRGTEARSEVPIEPDDPYELPVEATRSELVSSMHLAMLGVVARVRFPMGPSGPAPFVEAGRALASGVYARAGIAIRY